MAPYLPLKSAFLRITEDLPEELRDMMWWAYITRITSSKRLGEIKRNPADLIEKSVGIYERTFQLPMPFQKDGVTKLNRDNVARSLEFQGQ